MNGFQELVNVTTKGKWLEAEDFESIIAVVLENSGIEKDFLVGENLILVVAQMIEVGFLEFNKKTCRMRIRKEWYEQSQPV